METKTIEAIIAKHPSIALGEFYRWRYKFIPIASKLMLRAQLNESRKKAAQ